MVSTGATVGAIEVGVFFSSILYGAMLVQMYNYYKHNFDDIIAIKILVSSLSSLASHRASFLHNLAIYPGVRAKSYPVYFFYFLFNFIHKKSFRDGAYGVCSDVHLPGDDKLS